MMRTWIALAFVLVLLGCGEQKEPIAPKPTPGKDKSAQLPPAKPDKEPIRVPPTVAGPDHLDLIPSTATAFVTIRVSDIWGSDFVTRLHAALPKDALNNVGDLEAKIGMPIGEVRRISVIVYGDPHKEPPLGIVSTAKPVGVSNFKELLGPKPEEKTVDGLKVFALPGDKDLFLHLANDNLFLVGKVADIKKVLKKESGTGALGAALATAKTHHIVAAGDVGAILKDVKQNPPKEAKPFATLLETKSANLHVDVTKDITINGSFRFPAEDAAKKAETTLNGFVAMGRFALGEVPDPELQKKLGETLDAVSVKQQGDTVNLAFPLKGDEIVQVVKASMGKVAAASNRTVASNNLKQIGLAMHVHQDAMQTMPPAAITSADGKPLLSWRVAILPFVEQQALQQQFKMNEPWDSPANKKLIDKMPKLYAIPGVTDAPGMTRFRVFHGPKAAFEGIKGLGLAAFTDGTSNTLLVAEAGEAVPWTKPEELTYDPAKPLPKLGGGVSPDGFLVLLADGSVRFIDKKISEKILRALITRNGGETIGTDEK